MATSISFLVKAFYGASNGTTALTASSFAITFSQNGGTATGAVISSVKKDDNVAEISASSLTGGEAVNNSILNHYR